MKKIKTALISVYHKDGLLPVLEKLNRLDVTLYSTGGTYDFITQNGFSAKTVESLTDYPAILGGRVKTLHPKVFGGILARSENESDQQQLQQYAIPTFDLVMVDLYPFEETLKNTHDRNEIIEKIDIGGIALIRAAAKNYHDVLVVPSLEMAPELLALLEEKNGETSLDDRRYFAAAAFDMSSHYDTAIFHWMNPGRIHSFKKSIRNVHTLRYGENPHQKGLFYGDMDRVFEQLHGKAISYNNLQDLDAAIHLIDDFEETTFAVIKHNNACGLACRENLTEAWKDALAGDPVSAFGGVLVTNRPVDTETAAEINKIFFEIILAPGYSPGALELLQSKKNRIILRQKSHAFPGEQFRSVLNGVLWQDADRVTETEADLEVKTETAPTPLEIEDLLFANKIVKHTKSNAIVLAKNKQLLGSGTGQTSRVDALRHAIEKANSFNLSLKGAVMASDAFFPFADSVEIAHKAGITAVIQPGGSIRDKDSIAYCNQHQVSMVFTGVRHFKH
ncbi:bifunctional phosphoribosylaminoimidazolecarboxamide formyltransferase/IMP cyclohydrolase [Candidatus Sulfidibacterium hydrothermale]|uniref:bifunctional phosphoribosylaminoimidazolecarboxamide formyltransferase/IMP cyclohydrolase n=1 Tax=Candidatus Sulfidibacterium hydrothermale TaxID=2875962 RepID=UPI001F0AD405|nr:bifunctional phosphoribosylaminoimidazolecarboxamide formyltransferase/IMP cyclohydrolase [Candidatus Sulfidibacterium hydrothermale]UBM62265.1 bifunctional phosphoribosylaminoimidazolecarboxamide formyltransferase/IMP cyclohydrolase [Candidatus Sulfidibacterium hydrothermale]